MLNAQVISGGGSPLSRAGQHFSLQLSERVPGTHTHTCPLLQKKNYFACTISSQSTKIVMVRSQSSIAGISAAEISLFPFAVAHITEMPLSKTYRRCIDLRQTSIFCACIYSRIIYTSYFVCIFFSRKILSYSYQYYFHAKEKRSCTRSTERINSCLCTVCHKEHLRREKEGRRFSPEYGTNGNKAVVAERSRVVSTSPHASSIIVVDAATREVPNGEYTFIVMGTNARTDTSRGGKNNQ